MITFLQQVVARFIHPPRYQPGFHLAYAHRDHIDYESSFPSFRCGVKEGTTPESCPDCREVPTTDINSPLTCWECVCGGCVAYHEQDCSARQLTRTIIRLASLQCELSKLIRSQSMIGVIDSWRDVHGHPKYNIPPARIITWKICTRLASEEPPVSDDLPPDVWAQACSVENCVHAISMMSPAIAYWIEGLPLKLRELNIIPRPVMRVVLKRATYAHVSPPASVHTLLIVLPGEHKRESDCLPEDHPLEEVWDAGFVLDPTHAQYAFTENCETTREYLWSKAKESDRASVQTFGSAYSHHEEERDDHSEPWSWVREACLRALNDAVFRKTEEFGGRRAILEIQGHEKFLLRQKELMGEARETLKVARTTAEAILMVDHGHPPGPYARGLVCYERMKRSFEDMAEGQNVEGHRVLMAAFERMRHDDRASRVQWHDL